MISVLLQSVINMSCSTDCVWWYLSCCRVSLICRVGQNCVRWYLYCCRVSLTFRVVQNCVRLYLYCCRVSLTCRVVQNCVRWYLYCCSPSLAAQNIWTNLTTTGSFCRGWVPGLSRQQVRDTDSEVQILIFGVYVFNCNLWWHTLAVVQYTFTHKQYTEYRERNIHSN
jgi:hypothetical protein